MAFKIGIGRSDFEALREANNYYVDKTEFLYELVNDTDNTVSLFTRPRRFGKTLMMSMMENFFNINKDSRRIFSGLNITKHEDFCKEWMNQYPVLFLSLKDIEGETFEDAYEMLKIRISELCQIHSNLEKNDKLNKSDIDSFDKLLFRTAETAEIKSSLKTIMRMMRIVYGKPVIFLLDEYDVPLARASEKDTTENKFYVRMLDIIRGIMSTSLKDNEYLKFAVITGCLRISKESIFTGTNNFKPYSVLDRRFSTYFGFVEKEVDEMLEAAGVKELTHDVKEWYDGYVIGDEYLYCPWDVINYISDNIYDRNARPKNYWKNTSHNGILLSFVKRNDFDVSGKFEKLLNGGCIVQRISDELTYDTLDASEDNLWSVLLMTGYVTKADNREDEETVRIKIPNKEIASIFEDTVIRLFNDTLDISRQKEMMEAFWSRDEIQAGKIVSDLLWDTISFNDYHEDYYHAFLTGIFVGHGYEVESNKEKGLGRPDIVLLDRSNRRAIIIEAKKSVKETDMDTDCERAIEQINKQRYSDGLYGYKQILCYGIAFFQKQAKVKIGDRP